MIVECEEACATTSLMNFYSLDARLYKSSWASTMEEKNNNNQQIRLQGEIRCTNRRDSLLCVFLSYSKYAKSCLGVVCAQNEKLSNFFFSPSHSLLMKNYVNSHPIHLWKLIKKKKC